MLYSLNVWELHCAQLLFWSDSTGFWLSCTSSVCLLRSGFNSRTNKLLWTRFLRYKYREYSLFSSSLLLSGNFKESFSESTLYYNRDPMDHSSSESHVTGSASHRSSRSQTPVPKGNVHFSPNVTVDDRYSSTPNRGYTSYEGEVPFYSRICSLCRACLPSILLTLTSLFVVMIIAFEIDVEFFALLRRAPEMVTVRRQYYEPAKEQIQLAVNRVFQTISDMWARLYENWKLAFSRV